MNAFRSWLKKHNTFVLSIGFLVAFSASVSYAVPPTSPYNAGETLDPSCAPGTSNCTVTVSAGGSQWDDVTGGINYAGGRVGIGTVAPTVALDIVGALNTSLDSSIHGLQIGQGGGSIATNTALGFSALAGNTTGSLNTAIGYQALSVSGVSAQNTAVGYQALMNNTGNYNTAVGRWALLTNTTGTLNTAVGLNAMRFNTTGFGNTALGLNSLTSNVTGQSNTALGGSSMSLNTGGHYNTAIGSSSLFSNLTGSYNSGLGIRALYSATGSYNIALGAAVDVPVASGSGQLNIGNVLYGTGLYQNGIIPSSTPTVDGRIGIGTPNPIAALTVGGDGAVIATGTFGSGIAVPNLGAGSRMMWIPSAGAFRAGILLDFGSGATQWDNANVGIASVAFGATTTASGAASAAFGSLTVASGTYSAAFGSNTTASGVYSTAFGLSSIASGQSSNAFGSGAVASGASSTAFGSGSVASGSASTVFGEETIADSYNSFALGQYNIGGGDPDNWVDTDSVFEIGNGTSDGSRSNALTLLKNGYLGLNTSTPRAALDVAMDGSILATGTFGSGMAVPDLGAGSRMMWIPSAAAFRAGFVTSTQWDSANVGAASAAFGINTIASGPGAVAFGSATTASGTSSLSFGSATQATGDYSASFGSSTRAIGLNSAAFGINTQATAFGSFVIGRYNAGGGDPLNWVSTDPLFEIGNGNNGVDAANINALTVLKNGNVGIKTSTPGTLLSVGDGTVAAGNVAHFETSTGTCDLDPSDIGGLSCSSDMNLKKNITVLADNSPWSFNANITSANSSVFAKLIALTPVQYNFKAEADTDAKHTGFIAQEVEQLFPELVSTSAQGRKTMNYVGLVPYTIQAIREMDLNVIGIADLGRPNTWRESLIAWLGSANNGMQNIFSKKITTDQLCVGATCVTEEQFLHMVQQSGTVSSSGTIEDTHQDDSDQAPANDSANTQTPAIDNIDISTPVDGIIPDPIAAPEPSVTDPAAQ